MESVSRYDTVQLPRILLPVILPPAVSFRFLPCGVERAFSLLLLFSKTGGALPFVHVSSYTGNPAPAFQRPAP